MLVLFESEKSQPSNDPGESARHCTTSIGVFGANPVAVAVTRVPSTRPVAGSTVTWGWAGCGSACAPPGADPAASVAATAAVARPIAASALARRRMVVIPAPPRVDRCRVCRAAVGANP